ncbi:MAG: aldo/keto reductase [Deltaproteobacteria bacterium]|nr:aldo/keto reductase [Deltaproteobacteria bacterium]
MAYIPSTGEWLPPVGLGTWQVFDHSPQDPEWPRLRQVIDLFAKAGGRLVDSSPMYGRAEAAVGLLTAETPHPQKDAGWFRATKVWTTGRKAGQHQMEEGIQQMGPVDLIQVHNLLDWDSHWETLMHWKEIGKIRYTGFTHYLPGVFPQMEQLMERLRPDFIQIPYSMGEREAEYRILPLAADLGIGVIINRPFAEGGLFNIVGGKPLPGVAADVGAKTWGQFFLTYLLSHPAVTTAIPATGKPEHLADNLDAARQFTPGAPLPDPRLREKMAQAFDRL